MNLVCWSPSSAEQSPRVENGGGEDGKSKPSSSSEAKTVMGI